MNIKKKFPDSVIRKSIESLNMLNHSEVRGFLEEAVMEHYMDDSKKGQVLLLDIDRDLVRDRKMFNHMCTLIDSGTYETRSGSLLPDDLCLDFEAVEDEDNSVDKVFFIIGRDKQQHAQVRNLVTSYKEMGVN